MLVKDWLDPEQVSRLTHRLVYPVERLRQICRLIFLVYIIASISPDRFSGSGKTATEGRRVGACLVKAKKNKMRVPSSTLLGIVMAHQD